MNMIVKFHTTTEGKIKSTIYIRGFNTDFEIEIWRKEPVTIEYAQWWAQSQIINTAVVKGIEHHLTEGVLYIKNDNYREFEITHKNQNNGKN